MKNVTFIHNRTGEIMPKVKCAGFDVIEFNDNDVYSCFIEKDGNRYVVASFAVEDFSMVISEIAEDSKESRTTLVGSPESAGVGIVGVEFSEKPNVHIDFHGIASPISAFDEEDESMTDFEMNGRLLEASLILDCNVMDLIYIKETVKHRGFTADDKAELRGYGFVIKETFEKTITDLTGGSSSVSKGRVCTLMFTLDYIKRRRKKAKKANASNAKQK
ncbi:hypothetical protein ATE49_15115 [Elizabethkingia miricola]|uniref:Uncharacterized protein n=1 Tax=Elizabethkingia miricola TaxID=172045 RepID=A0ABY3NB78_ELIMR|nr:hypothetical protein [Elizabethkingia miricola]OBS12981.1 hypothetical protein ATE49_15115 [Elizabethkingia miricola]TYO84197.1 hypothetical protein LX74_03996 [Elizabethkingia miricola]